MHQIGFPFAALLFPVLLAGCSAPSQGGSADTIPFKEGQYYAAAYLGYQETGPLEDYVRTYLEEPALPVHHLSDGDYYLVIPRYSGMSLSLYRNDMESGRATLLYEAPDCGPFLLQCNVSDIFPDATIRLTYEGVSVEFSPFVSLKDGAVDIGSCGLDLAGTLQS